MAGLPVAARTARRRQPPQWSYDPASPWSPLAALEQAGDSRSADIYWYHTDLNSAPLEVTDAAGNLCWSGQYDTFGKLQGQTVAGAAKRQGAQYQQPLRYTGQRERSLYILARILR